MKLVILDRDGVINQDSDNYIKSPSEWTAIPGSLEAIAALQRAEFKIAVVTNQSGIGRGLYDETMLDNIHAKMRDELASVGGSIDKLVYCPHLPGANCNCRKPRTELLSRLAQHFENSLANAYFVGDSLKDLIAAKDFGCKPILVLSGKGEKTKENLPYAFEGVPCFKDLQAFVLHLLKNDSI